MPAITNKTTITNTIIGATGIILGVTVSLAMAHISDFSIHAEKSDVVSISEFNQFQKRILDGLGNIQVTQQELKQDIKDIERSLSNR